MKVATRQVYFAGCTVNPDFRWMEQIARNITAAFDGFLNGARYLLMDWDTKYADAFRCILRQAGVIGVRLPPRSPNLNAHIERFMRSLGEECVDRLIFFGKPPEISPSIREGSLCLCVRGALSLLASRPGAADFRDSGRRECQLVKELAARFNFFTIRAWSSYPSPWPANGS